jgi:serine O-acetyltransferase
MGIVIGKGAVIGDDVRIMQGVTLGERMSSQGRGGYPTIGNGVLLCAGAVVLGEVTVGDSAVVGANAVVLDDVATGETVVGSPARHVGRRWGDITESAGSIPVGERLWNGE